MPRQNPTKEQDAEETCTYDNSNNYYHNNSYNSSNQYKGHRPFACQNNDRAFRSFNIRGRARNLNIVNNHLTIRDFRDMHIKALETNSATTVGNSLAIISRPQVEEELVGIILIK